MPKKYSLEKEKAIKLRKEGYSYREISSVLNIAKSTLSVWFKEYSDLDVVKMVNITKNTENSKLRIVEINKKRREVLLLEYSEIENNALLFYENYKKDLLFVSGLSLYIGCGDNKSKSHIRIVNINWKIHLIFIKFCQKYLKYSKERICLEIIAYNDLDHKTIESFWKDKLQLTKVYKTQFVERKSRNKLQYGTGMTIINDTKAKLILLKWIDLYLIENAGMV